MARQRGPVQPTSQKIKKLLQSQFDPSGKEQMFNVKYGSFINGICTNMFFSSSIVPHELGARFVEKLNSGWFPTPHKAKILPSKQGAGSTSEHAQG